MTNFNPEIYYDTDPSRWIYNCKGCGREMLTYEVDKNGGCLCYHCLQDLFDADNPQNRENVLIEDLI